MRLIAFIKGHLFNNATQRGQSVKVNKATVISLGLMAVVSLASIWAANNVKAVGSITEKKGWF